MPFTTLTSSAYTTLDATKLTGNLPAISGASLTGISGGKVSQVKEFHYTSYLAKTDSSSFDDGLHVDITPSSTSSKVLVLSVGNLSKNGVTEAVYRLFRQTGGSGDSGWTTSATRVATDVGAWSGNTSADRMVAGNVFWLCQYYLAVRNNRNPSRLFLLHILLQNAHSLPH